MEILLPRQQANYAITQFYGSILSSYLAPPPPEQKLKCLMEGVQGRGIHETANMIQRKDTVVFSLDQSHEMSSYWSHTQLFHECVVFGDLCQPPHSNKSYSSSS